MNRWLIWAAAGVVGIILAIVAIPWTLAPIDSTDPTLDLPAPREDATPDPRPSDPTAAVGDGPMHFEDEAPTAGTSAGGSTEVVGGEPPDPGRDGGFVNPARAERQERLEQPDLVAARSSASRWRSLVRTVAMMEHDPAADHTMRRIRELEADLAAYRRDPGDYDMTELIDRQRNIMGELRQTSYWTPEVQEIDARLEETFSIYQTESEE